MDWFKLAYTVLGGLGIFFFGMKALSDALQAIGGPFIRRMIASLTNNRFIAVLVGLFVTTIVQSSSITTVMVVSFVNAGLMDLMQAIGVILGANIGTTITGWIIAVKIGKYSLLLIGIAFLPMLQTKSERLAGWGKVIFGLGLIFLGLNTMSGAFKPLRTDEAFLSMMTYFTASDYGSLWATIAIGCALTFIVQSSSAMLGITVALATAGAINFQTSAGLVLGENIGTTVTALLAGLAGNRNAKRAALAHAMFNVFGVFVISTFFWAYLDGIESLVPNAADFVDASGERPYIAAHIAAGHTVFNVVNVIVFLPLMGILAKIATKAYPDRGKEIQALSVLGSQATVSPSIAIAQARQELVLMGGIVLDMIEMTKKYFGDPKLPRPLRKRILKKEKVTDAIHLEMMEFIGHVMQSGLTTGESEAIKRQLKTSDELESLADYCQKLVMHRKRLSDDGVSLDDKTNQDLQELFDIVLVFFNKILDSMRDETTFSRELIMESKAAFDAAANKLRDTFLDRVGDSQSPASASLTVGDIVLSLGRVFSHARNLGEWQLGEKSSQFTD